MQFDAPVCFQCKHLFLEEQTSFSCAAFPQGIPFVVISHQSDHTEPIEGDKGLQFEPIAASTKGGPGSGNFGHAGRPGRIGGSQPNTGTNRPRTVFGVRVARPVSLGDYLTAKHYADLKISTRKPVATDPAFLPKVKEGYTRIYHGTSAQKAQGILDRGLLFGSTVKDREALPFIMATTGSTSSFGEVNFVVDLSPESMKKAQKVNESWVEIYQEIKPSQIVGVYLRPHRIGMDDAVWLRDAILEHKDLSE